MVAEGGWAAAFDRLGGAGGSGFGEGGGSGGGGDRGGKAGAATVVVAGDFVLPCDRSAAERVMSLEPQPGQVTMLSGLASGPMGVLQRGQFMGRWSDPGRRAPTASIT
ncbi:MAG TPA: hypothetical protein VMT70_20115 [Vicinamibacteria bacterium]|nr:hypothetical protein [Vicinamibacteria bacterium]